MFECKKHGYGQNIELMRRSTPARMNKHKVWTEDEYTCLRSLFYMNEGLSHIALLFGTTELEIMRVIQELNLYNSYSFPMFHNYFGDNDVSPEEELGENFNQDPYTQCVETMRRATASFDEGWYQWTQTHSEILKEMFEGNADITTIALSFSCTEPMIIRMILALDLYNSGVFGADWGPYTDSVRYYPELNDYGC